MIQNPILRGFNPDPCICRKGDDYYIVVSSFEWLPGLPVYHSKDLKNWELYTHILKDESMIDVSRLPSGQGVWAPCISYCEQDDLFYVVYGSVVPRGTNIDNYLITAKDIKGPWSEPIYLQSSGFDASLFHDDDGRKWVVSLEWERREGYQKPGAICLAEYSHKEKKVIDYPKRIWAGGTTRGWIEGPHIYKHNGKYYIMCAEGGTGFHHCTSMGRADNIFGPYEKDPQNPIITSIITDGTEGIISKVDNLKFYNPDILLQKSGHASLVETQDGEYYAVHLCSRPFVPELRCTLGRETAIQKMTWTEDGWLRKKNGYALADEFCEESTLPEVDTREIPEYDDFNDDKIGMFYYAPRHSISTFANVWEKPGYVRIRGQEVLDSFDKVSILARKLTSVHMIITTKMKFKPEVHQHTAGLVLYYDNLNYLYLRKYFSETLGASALSIVHAEKGVIKEFTDTRVKVSDEDIFLRMIIDGNRTYFQWSYGEEYVHIGGEFDTSKFSDEYCGEFTGTFIGITCTDGVFRRQYADFDFFEMKETI